MRTKTAENKKKEANIQPLDQKSLLLLFFIHMAKIKCFPAGNPDRAVKPILPYPRLPHNNVC